MLLPLGIAVALVCWAYVALLCRRWDKHACKVDPETYGSSARGAGAFLLYGLFWWAGLTIMSSDRPSHPWRITDPRPSRLERIRAAEERSLEMEREAGLEFDGVFLVSPPATVEVEEYFNPPEDSDWRILYCHYVANRYLANRYYFSDEDR